MSVKHNKNGGGNTAALEKEVQEVKAAGESTAALLSLSFKAQIVQDRAAGTNVISDAMILQSAEVIDYPGPINLLAKCFLQIILTYLNIEYRVM